MSVKFYQPKSSILRKYVEGFYFMNTDGGQPFEYYTFPNNFCIVSVLRNADLVISQDEAVLSRSLFSKELCSLTYRYRTPLRVVYKEPVDEITIYFKPFGIHQFVKGMERFLTPESSASFDPFPEFRSHLSGIFDIGERTEQICRLEEVLLGFFEERKDLFLDEILSLLEDDVSVEEISRQLNVSRQYLGQYFKLKIGKTLSEYRLTERFRKSLQLMKSGSAHNFTELTYENLYFDQSHFSKDFKAITNLSPKEFFRRAQWLDHNVWLIV
ncbi:helix-turn-helix domain-containing protein [Weeksellaceae bacterium A-14]